MYSSSEHRQLSCGLLAQYFVKLEFTFLVFGKAMISINGMKIDGLSHAVFQNSNLMQFDSLIKSPALYSPAIYAQRWALGGFK